MLREQKELFSLATFSQRLSRCELLPPESRESRENVFLSQLRGPPLWLCVLSLWLGLSPLLCCCLLLPEALPSWSSRLLLLRWRLLLLPPPSSGSLELPC